MNMIVALEHNHTWDLVSSSATWAKDN